MPCVLILSERGVITSTSLWPNPAPPQLYSMEVLLPTLLSTFALHAFVRCSNRAREATFATHWRAGSLAPGAPLISHRPGWVSASVGKGCAAVSASAPPTPKGRTR